MTTPLDADDSAAPTPPHPKRRRKSSRPRRHPRSPRLLRTLRPWARLVCLALLLPALFAGGAGAAYYYRLHRICDAMTLDGLPAAPAADPQRRILVLAPHCDDETLGAGAFIADARGRGAHVTVAFLTNGDGFRVAASRALGEVTVEAPDFIRFAELRQKEAVAALAQLGVPETDVQFLGYPDRGLRPLWEAHWDDRSPFRSGFTGRTRVPYRRAFSPRAPYSGRSLTDDLVRLMERVRPTDILVTHPADDHPDHNAAPAFAQAALRTCAARGDAWTGAARMRYYIVHRGDWPLPQGRNPDRPLLPPPGLLTRDTRWNVFAAPDAAREAKARALERYESQTSVSGRFLWSFVRTNELFADLPTPHAGAGSAGGGCETTAGGPYGDTLARYVEPGADLTGLSVAEEGDSLRIRLTTRGPASPRLRYRLTMRGAATGPDGRTVTRFTTEPLRLSPADAAGPVAARPHALEARIPLARVGLTGTGRARRVWVSAEARWGNRLPLIDRTGYRPFVLEDRAAAGAAPRRVAGSSRI